jgi:hypothetical protein
MLKEIEANMKNILCMFSYFLNLTGDIGNKRAWLLKIFTP